MTLNISQFLTPPEHAVIDHEPLPGVLSSTEHTGTNHSGIAGVGKVVSQQRIQSSSSFALNTTPEDATIPQISEGSFITQIVHSMASSGNILGISFTVYALGGTGGQRLIPHIHINGVANAVAAMHEAANSAFGNFYGAMTLHHFYSPGTTASQTISARAGGPSTINSPTFGGRGYATLIITEYAPG